MSDMHHLPLLEHDLDLRAPRVRARVHSATPYHWYWEYIDTVHDGVALQHGPFASQPEAFASAYRMVELL